MCSSDVIPTATAGVASATLDAGLLAMLVHTVGYLSVTVLMAVLVYERLGLRILRTAWVNLDQLWAMALIGTAAITVLF